MYSSVMGVWSLGGTSPAELYLSSYSFQSITSPTSFQREVASDNSRRIALRPMNGRSSVSMSRNIQPKPSSIGVERCSSFQAKRLDSKSALRSRSPASIRAINRAV